MTVEVWEPRRWRAAAHEHEERARAATADRDGRRDAVGDFLFTYYSLRPGALRRWHPGVGVGLRGAEAHRDWRWYRTRDEVTSLDVDAFRAGRASALAHFARLLAAVDGRAARHDCFGLHEWAMVYRSSRPRHEIPLRLGAAGTDAVVEALPLTCSHVDAYRFFTAAAVPRNRERLTRESQVHHDQPGCVHVTMDLYKAAYKLGPAVPGSLLLDCFDLARRARVVDMRASPYDLTELGHDPIAIETAAGRAEYAAAQRELTDRARPLRRRLLAVLDGLAAPPASGAAGPALARVEA